MCSWTTSSPSSPREGQGDGVLREQRVGWIALTGSRRGRGGRAATRTARHGGQDYWLSPEVLTGPQVADILSDVLGTKIVCEMQSPDVLRRWSQKAGRWKMKYAEGAVEFTRQVSDGRMGYIGTVRDDGPFVTGRPSTTLREWAAENRESLLRAVSGVGEVTDEDLWILPPLPLSHREWSVRFVRLAGTGRLRSFAIFSCGLKPAADVAQLAGQRADARLAR